MTRTNAFLPKRHVSLLPKGPIRTKASHLTNKPPCSVPRSSLSDVPKRWGVFGGTEQRTNASSDSSHFYRIVEYPLPAFDVAHLAIAVAVQRTHTRRALPPPSSLRRASVPLMEPGP